MLNLELVGQGIDGENSDLTKILRNGLLKIVGYVPGQGIDGENGDLTKILRNGLLKIVGYVPMTRPRGYKT